MSYKQEFFCFLLLESTRLFLPVQKRIIHQYIVNSGSLLSMYSNLQNQNWVQNIKCRSNAHGVWRLCAIFFISNFYDNTHDLNGYNAACNVQNFEIRYSRTHDHCSHLIHLADKFIHSFSFIKFGEKQMFSWLRPSWR